MIRVFYGENRLEAEKNLKKILGEDFETFDGENLQINDLPSIFRGMTLFGGEKRRILLKNLAENPAVLEKIADYADTDNEVVIWETKIDKRLGGLKALKEVGVEMREFLPSQPPEMKAVFGIFELAQKDAKKAVAEVEKIEGVEDPFMFFGLLVSQALKQYELAATSKRKQILKLLAETDLEMKSSPVEPWLQIKSLLLKIEAI